MEEKKRIPSPNSRRGSRFLIFERTLPRYVFAVRRRFLFIGLDSLGR